MPPSASLVLNMEVQAPGAIPVQTMPASAATTVDFDVFYTQNIDRLIDVFTATLINRSIAEDAAQEAMIRACQRWGKIGGYRNPFGWCYRVGLNWATSRWRKHRRELSTDVFDDVATVPASELTDPTLVQALQKLPVEQRAVVVLRLWMDWSSKETAEALNIPQGTVHSRLSRALERLRIDLTTAEAEVLS